MIYVHILKNKQRGKKTADDIVIVNYIVRKHSKTVKTMLIHVE